MRAKLIFEKISGTDKLLARQIKRKRGKKLLISEMKWKVSLHILQTLKGNKGILWTTLWTTETINTVI